MRWCILVQLSNSNCQLKNQLEETQKELEVSTSKAVGLKSQVDALVVQLEKAESSQLDLQQKLSQLRSRYAPQTTIHSFFEGGAGKKANYTASLSVRDLYSKLGLRESVLELT